METLNFVYTKHKMFRNKNKKKEKRKTMEISINVKKMGQKEMTRDVTTL